MKILYIPAADVMEYDDDVPVSGTYVKDGADWHGPFADRAEACAFVAYMERDVVRDERHQRTLGAGV